MEWEGEGQREWQRQRVRVRMRCRLQDEWRAAGARRHVGHAPELRREQRGGGLLEALRASLTTASAAVRRRIDGLCSAKGCRPSGRAACDSGTSEKVLGRAGAEGRGGAAEAGDVALGSRECGVACAGHKSPGRRLAMD